MILAYDVVPTMLELAGAESESYVDRGDTLPITGRSFAGLLRSNGKFAARSDNDAVGREHGGNAAIRRGDWKLLWVGDSRIYLGEEPAEPGPPPMSGLPMPRERFDRGSPAGTPIGTGGPWRLYNIKDDPAERHDMSENHPEIAEELLAEWEDYVAENGVLAKSGER